jgi:hypothetical protein
MRQNGWQRGTVDKPFVPCMKMHGMEGIFLLYRKLLFCKVKIACLRINPIKFSKKAHDIKEGEQR